MKNGMRIINEIFVKFSPLLVFSCLQSCSPGNPLEKWYFKKQIDHLSKAREEFDLGNTNNALNEIKKDIKINGLSTSNLLLRARIYEDTGLHDEALVDIFEAHDIATQLYYKDGGPYGLYISAYCIGIIGDEDRARSDLILLKRRFPNFTLTDTDQEIESLLDHWKSRRLKSLAP